MNNEPAFPATEAHGLNSGTHGMTLRDYFAAHAPSVPETWRAKNDEAENIIKWRWAYADAMMEARGES